jgi:putative hydrolase of the HAD superfamily
MTADMFARAYYAADDPLVGALPIAAGLSQTVDALASNLEAELGWGGSDRGRSVASRFLSDMSAIIDRNRPILEALRARYRLGVVSNFTGNLEPCLAELGIRPLFGSLADSTLVGAAKPDPRIFHVVLDELKVGAEDAWMVGDNPEADIRPATALGMRTIWLAPESRATPQGLNPTRRVAKLTDIESYLD